MVLVVVHGIYIKVSIIIVSLDNPVITALEGPLGLHDERSC